MEEIVVAESRICIALVQFVHVETFVFPCPEKAHFETAKSNA